MHTCRKLSHGDPNNNIFSEVVLTRKGTTYRFILRNYLTAIFLSTRRKEMVNCFVKQKQDLR